MFYLHNKFHHFIFIISMIGTASLSANEANKDPWPYPQDTPDSVPLKIGTASQRPIDITRFLLTRGVYQVSINKPASHIAYIDRVTGQPQVWVKQLQTGLTKQLTFGNGVQSYRWHPDGQNILYSSDNDGDEKEAFYFISIDGEQESVILPHSEDYRLMGTFNESGDKFSYASTERNGRDFDLYLYDFNNNSTKLVFQSEFGFYPSAWQPKANNFIMSEVRGEDANNLYLLNTNTSEVTTLFKPDISAYFGSIQWNKKGSGFYTSTNLDVDKKRIIFVDVKTKNTTVIEQSDHEIENLAVCSNDQFIVWTENDNGFYNLYVKSLQQPSNKRKIPLPAGTYGFDCSDNNNQLVVNASSYQSPSEVYIVDLTTLSSTILIQSQLAGIAANEMIKAEAISFTAQDGVTIHGLLYIPHNKTKAKAPLVVSIHGGPTAQAVAGWRPLAQYLLGKGIAVLDINVRGSTGYGKTYARLDNQEKRLDSVRDLVDALNYLQNDDRVDAKRAAAIGGSYGGYMVNAVMGLYPNSFKAGASFVGVSNWVRALQTAHPSLKASDLIEYGDIRDTKWQKFYEANSPINTVNKITAPMFFQHGVNDPRDPVTESDEMVQALRKKNIPVTYLRFADEGHQISKLENRITFYRELAKFLEQHL
ncbi:S9 family peptidase [Shewanella gaetbuli]